MAEIDKGLIGSVIEALPISSMIAGPMGAVIDAQIGASLSYAKFLEEVCIENGVAKTVDFNYQETLVDPEGEKPAQVVEKHMTVPLMSVIPLPSIGIDSASVDFELEVSQSCETKTESASEGSFSAKAGWGPFSVKMSGKASHKREQTRKTDTRAKYSFHVEMSRLPASEGLTRVMEFLTDAATKPTPIPGAQAKAVEAKPSTPAAA